MKVLVCGGRAFRNVAFLNKVLDEQSDITEIISGGANGADMLGILWANKNKIKTTVFMAEWNNKYGKAAGPLRNQRMLDEGKPDLVIAFPGGVGTADMVYRSKQAGIKVRIENVL